MADAMARFKRLSGYDVRFLTGTDEHGQKIETLANAKGVTPQQYVDEVVAGIKELWKTMEISYDEFIRTTEPRHVERVQKIFMKMCEKYQYKLSEEAEAAARERIIRMEAEKGENFANAREVRNLFEKIITNQAARVSEIEDVDEETLATITIDDLKDLDD
jgi:methionyl-tRNA synthetase